MLPTELKFGGDQSVEIFAHNSASWHKSCHVQFSNYKLKRATKRKESNTAKEEDSDRQTTKRRSIDMMKQCFLCEDGSNGENALHRVESYDMDKGLRTMINDLQDTKLLARITAWSDLIAMDATYHLPCLTQLRNRYRTHLRQLQPSGTENTDDRMNESRAFVELAGYIDMSMKAGRFLFKLSELHSLYIKRLEELNIIKTINKTRFKDQLLERFTDAQEQQDGKSIVIIFKDGMKGMIEDAMKKRDFTEDALILAQAAKIVRKDIFSHEGFQFTGQFPSGCQEESLPSSLKCLVSMMINGPNVMGSSESQVCLTIGQMIVHNVKKKRKQDSLKKVRHNHNREPPLPIFIGLNIHALTRSKKIIQQLYQMGISISYDRVMEIEEWLATAACERFEADGIVAPTILRKGLFTVGALDNLDHNPSATTAKTSFHGTGISTFQFPNRREAGVTREPFTLPPSNARAHSLPDFYATVPAVSLKYTDVQVPERNGDAFFGCDLATEKYEEHKWMENSLRYIGDFELSKTCSLTWSAYHATRHQQTSPEPEPKAICALLPLFYEKSDTPAMIKHGMNVHQQVTQYLNPGQIPVITFDQPLFALAKYVQWKWPELYGEKVYVVMMGGLHIEKALWNTIGDLLEGSGWTTALTESEVARSGTADSFLNVTHITRTWHAHQVTVLALHRLLNVALKMRSNVDESSSNWLGRMCEKSPTFKFWHMILQYEILVHIFVRAHRERNFSLYVTVLEALVPLFFALDHVNYARWLPVHIRDMKLLPNEIQEEFETRNSWTIVKSLHRYSAIPIDQAHEQENKVVKASGGAVGLTENPVAFSRWMTAGPELSRLLRQYEDEYLNGDDQENLTNFEHHEQGFAAQKAFQRQVDNLFNKINNMGNPFMDYFPELVTLDSRICANDVVVNTILTLEETGTKQYQDYVKNILEDRSRSIHDTISKNSLPLFSTKFNVNPKRPKIIKALENNVALFGQLYISLQNRDGDVDEFFAHEVQCYPPSLSEFGMLYLPGTKSQLLQCIGAPNQTEAPAVYDCKVVDGAVAVHALPVVNVSTFVEYAKNVFIPYLERQLRDTKRLDVVWDDYRPDSLKEATRELRGKGVRRKVSSDVRLPGNWSDFLRDPINKKELFEFLSFKVRDFCNVPHGSSVYITYGEVVTCIGSQVEMSSCNHEEADTRIVVHVVHALQNGAKSIQVRTVDTDIVVILVGLFHELVKMNSSGSLGSFRNWKELHSLKYQRYFLSSW